MNKQLKNLLVILNLDETLVHSTSKKNKNRGFDYSFEDIAGYIRPGAREFIDELFNNENIDVMVWTQSSEGYAKRIVDILGIDDSRLKLLFSRKSSVIAPINRDSPDYGYYPHKNLKDLTKVKRKLKHPFSRMIAIDDNPDYYERQYSNLIKIPKYEGENNEISPFETIIKYIDFLEDKPNVRPYEKRRIFNGTSKSLEKDSDLIC